MHLRSLIVFERLEDMGFVAYAQSLHLLCFYLFFVRYGVHAATTDTCHRGRGVSCGISIVQAGLNMDNQLLLLETQLISATIRRLGANVAQVSPFLMCTIDIWRGLVF
jgi:hypothetical protein